MLMFGLNESRSLTYESRKERGWREEIFRYEAVVFWLFGVNVLTVEHSQRNVKLHINCSVV